MSLRPNKQQLRDFSHRKGKKGKGPTVTSVAMGAFAFALAGAAIVLATIQALSVDLPKLDQLEAYTPRLITKVLGIDGTVVKEFYTERRVQVPLDSISPYLAQAALATEDRRFYSHWGVDPIGIMRAIAIDVITLSKKEGASTLTQQLARNLYLHRRQTWKRKIREMITAVQIERTYSKDEVLQMYFTQIYFGHGSYGVQSAAKFYFGVSANNLNLPQAALLLGLVQLPNYYSPFRNPEAAVSRRNTVLRRMLASEYISEDEYHNAIDFPLELATDKASTLGTGPYFTEWIRRDLERMQSKYDFDYYKDGLIVNTTLDPVLQNIAETVVHEHADNFQLAFNKRFTENGLYDWLVKSYKDSLKVIADISEEDSLSQILYTQQVQDSIYIFASNILRTRIVADTLSIDTLYTELDPSTPDTTLIDSIIFNIVFDTTFVGEILDNLELTERALANEILKDPAIVDSLLVDHFTVQVAFVAMDPENGDVWSMIGGRDFNKYKYNRAVQAIRQPGSVFKPFVYTTAIDNGIYANYQILNMVQPLKMGDGTWWRPENYNPQNRGEYISLRNGLRRSLNNITVRMVAGDDKIVPIREVIRYARAMGITTPLAAVPALALGSNGVIPLEIVTAYSVFASGGARPTPRSILNIEDRNGQEIASFGVKREAVLSEETAAIMVDLLAGVLNRGTGGSSRWKWGFRAPAAGKTGTTNNFNNAWFVGFSPHVVAGVWIGFDDPKKSLGRSESGARAALPMWAKFMKQAYEEKGWSWDNFELPVGVQRINICEDSGMLAGPSCPHVYGELFRRGDAPTDPCETHKAPGASW
jgi:penicillin-binding protein 1A